MTACHYGCGATVDLRPYGPGGAPICFLCMKADPERERAAERALSGLWEAEEAVRGHVVIDTDQEAT